MWLRAKNKAGLTVPWAYIRRRVAQNWHVPPWVVDEAAIDEVMLELRLMELETETAHG